MIFINNKYTKYYFNIINQAKSRNLATRKQAKSALGYVELHHVIPRALNGTNCTNNTVFLTAREHFICHWLLVKMTTGAANHKMVYALSSMSRISTNHRYCTKITARVFETLKIQLAIAKRITHTGKLISTEQKAKQRAKMLGRTHSPEHIANQIAGRINRTVTDETKQKLSAAQKGKTFSEEHKAKLVIAWANRRLAKK